MDVPPLDAPTPFVDQSGRLSPHAFEFLRRLWLRTGGFEDLVEALEGGEIYDTPLRTGHHQSIERRVSDIENDLATQNWATRSQIDNMPIKEYFLEVSRGNIAGQSSVNKFGRNPEIDVASSADIYDNGDATGGVASYPYLSSAETHNIASTSTNDDGSPAGTGARTVTVIGVDGDYNEISEVVTMDGTTNVLTTNSYLRIYRMYVTTVGSVGTNDGEITATASSSGSISASILTGLGQTLMAIYTIPAGKTGYMYSYYAGMGDTVSTGDADVRLLIRENNGSWQIKHYMGLIGAGVSHFDHAFKIPIKIPEKSDIRINVHVTANNTTIGAGFDIILVDN